MNLQTLEIRNFRSIKEQCGENALEFEGLDCLVGKNNAGKTNIISSIKYLLQEQDKELNEELYWNKDTSLHVEVRGYFNIQDGDIERIPDEEKQDEIRDLLLDQGDQSNLLGVSRITNPDGNGSTNFKLIQFLPVTEGWTKEEFREYRDEQWARKSDEDGFTGTDYRDDLIEEYPEVAEFVDDDSLTQKGAWMEGYEDYIQTRPDDLEFEPQPSDFPSGTKQVIKDLILPNVVKIPAIKEVEDAAQASGELGEMTDALYSELEEDINEELDDRLDGVYERLDTESSSFESRISDYLREAFSDYSVEIDFPRIESRRLFRDVDIRIEDDQLEDTLSHENVGEGVRRVLVFSLLRTIADLRDESLSITNGSNGQEGNRKPLLILYEEAELFLHPNLQKNMLRVFRNLCNNEAQIVFNTHSPVLIQNRIIDTINIVRKNSGTEITQFHTALEGRTVREQSRLMDLQKVSSYIFSDRVVLVEGQSDEIVLTKIASTFNSEWVFEIENIPILELGGKEDLPIFKTFLEELGIEVFAMADIGVLEGTIHEIIDSESIENQLHGLKGEAGSIADGSWRDVITDDNDRINSDRLQVRTDMLEEEDILVLNGEIEDYYPDEGISNKTEAALNFSATEYNIEELKANFIDIPEYGTTDMEIFLRKIFA